VTGPADPKTPEQKRREAANKLAIAAFVLALVLAGVFVLSGDSLSATKTTVVTNSKVPKVAGSTNKTTVVKRIPGTPTETTKTTERVGPTAAKPESVTSTTETAAPSFLERALGDGGLDVLRLGVILLAAFLAAAVAQRLALGEFHVKIGTFELGAVAGGATAAADAVEKKLSTKLTEQAEHQKQDSLLVKDALRQAIEELRRLEQRLDRLKSDNQLR
jgi:hypothetical protein